LVLASVYSLWLLQSLLLLFANFLGCIECMQCIRCSLLLPMCAMSVRQSVSLSVHLSRGSTRLHCAKTVERIKILFGMNISGGLWNIVLDGGPDPPQTGRGTPFKLWDPLVSPKRGKARDLKFCVHIEACMGTITKTMQN